MMEILIFYVVFSTIVSFVILTNDTNKWWVALILSVCFGFILFPIAMGNAIAKINKI